MPSNSHSETNDFVSLKLKIDNALLALYQNDVEVAKSYLHSIQRTLNSSMSPEINWNVVSKLERI